MHSASSMSHKIYLHDSFSKRKDTFMPEKYKCYKRRSFWRIDGKIELNDWVDLISFFFKSNEMIIEYFNPEQFIEMFELRIRDFEAWKCKQDDKGVSGP